MNLIDTYISEVGRRLPRKNRLDIEAEIRSVLQDMLEERSQTTGKPVDDELTFEVLKEYGAPEKVAASYMPERYLIGPRLYPIFLTVVRIVFPAIVIIAATSVLINLSQHAATMSDLASAFGYALVGLATSAISALGNLVLIFAIIEWVLRNEGITVKGKERMKEKEWDPRSLTRISTPNQVKLGEKIAEIVTSFAAIVIFNFYPQIIGFTPSLNSVAETGNWSSVTFVPLLSEAFLFYVPYLTLVWALTIFLDIFLLRQGTWNAVTRIFAIGLKLISIIIAASMLAVPSLVALTTETLAAGIGDAGAAQILMSLISQIVHIALWIVIIVESIEVVRLVYRLVVRTPAPTFANKKQPN